MSSRTPGTLHDSLPRVQGCGRGWHAPPSSRGRSRRARPRRRRPRATRARRPLRPRAERSTAPVDEGGRFSREKRFAGDVDVDDVELRLVEDQWRVDSGTRASSSSSSSSRPRPRPRPCPRTLTETTARRDLYPDRPRSCSTTARSTSDYIATSVVTVKQLAGWGSGALVPRGPLSRAPGRRARSRRRRRAPPPPIRARTRPTLRGGVRARRARDGPEGRLVVATGCARRASSDWRGRRFSPRHEWNPPLTRLRDRRFCACAAWEAPRRWRRPCWIWWRPHRRTISAGSDSARGTRGRWS